MQTIGERLEEARKKKGISIREAAEATKIRGDYLQKFENNQFDIGLTDLYVRGFIRTYCHFLKVPHERILNDFAALGRGDTRPRQVNREVYGRMEVSIASATGERNDPPAANTGEDDGASAAPARRSSPTVNRGPNASHGSAIDPALVFKFGKWAAAGVGAILVIWGLWAVIGSFTSGSSTKPAATPPATSASTPITQSAAEPTITLVALDTVRVTVTRKNADGTEGATLYTGTLMRGQSQAVPKPGPIFILASAAENLEIEIDGRRWPTGQKGYKKMQLQ